MNPYELAGRWRYGLQGEYVYFARPATGDGPVKIGTTTNLTCRLAALHTGSPVEIAFAAVLPGGQPPSTTSIAGSRPSAGAESGSTPPSRYSTQPSSSAYCSRRPTRTTQGMRSSVSLSISDGD